MAKTLAEWAAWDLEQKAKKEKMAASAAARAKKVASRAKKTEQAAVEAGLVALSGDTYPHRDLIRSAGGKWDADAKVWRVPASEHARVNAVVNRIPSAEERAVLAAAQAQVAAERRAAEAEQARIASAERAERERAEAAARVVRENEIVAVMQVAAGTGKFATIVSRRVSGVAGGEPTVTVSGPGLSGTRDISDRIDVKEMPLSRRVTRYEARVPRMPEGWKVTVRYWDNRDRVEVLDPVQDAAP